MAKTLQLRRGTTAELSSVTGAVGELFVDTTKDTVVVMDGSTAGGFPLQRQLTAGSGINITNNTISATGGGGSFDQNLNTTDEVTFKSVLAGNLLIEDNIIAPLTRRIVTSTAYGNVTSNVAQPVLVSGDLTVTGNLVTGGFNINLGSATRTNQGNLAIAVGHWSGNTSQSQAAIAIGSESGYSSQGVNTVAVGSGAGRTNQGESAVAIGAGAGNQNQSARSVAYGHGAGGTSQGSDSVGVGYFAGATSQGQYSVAIGRSAGFSNQGGYAIAIGSAAGYSNQPAQSIVINASSSSLNGEQTGALYVNPVRVVNNGGSLPSGFYNMAYNPSTKEIIYYT